ncbi:uncharacterized protein FOMMEDRAFT_170961 [Fomitiporia mediterranea MF3/22]|uniref:uncharacterized protein n=1 Tax=Fomitiporia mediterranea (strain MF3/22) TaxID=694068 RepID=UPI0004409BCD|nr:uncharacterized protein FOMMEDRAFT_170961 [Fomitiporia mediterranea MF3/22]EJC98760.1 hypothetical protein FOMMEDRAFT_170961 [Fomitiporia mediterranea MF3/22]
MTFGSSGLPCFFQASRLVHNFAEAVLAAIAGKSSLKLYDRFPAIPPFAMAASTKDALELIDSINSLQISAHIDTACFALLIYDYLLTFEDERTLIWQSEWSFAKIVFLITRYFPAIDLSMTTMYHFGIFTLDECYRRYKAGGHLINTGIAIAELIPIVRTWAIWEKSRTITIILFIWAAINVGIDIVFITLYFNAAQFAPLPPGVPGCLLVCALATYLKRVAHVAFDARDPVLKGIQLYREYEDKQLRNSVLFKAFFANGVIFYVYIFALSVANVIVITTFPRNFAGLLASVERVAHAVLMERLVFTLCKAARPGLDEQYLTKLDTIRFERGQRGPIETEVTTGTLLSSSAGN